MDMRRLLLTLPLVLICTPAVADDLLKRTVDGAKGIKDKAQSAIMAIPAAAKDAMPEMPSMPSLPSLPEMPSVPSFAEMGEAATKEMTEFTDQLGRTLPLLERWAIRSPPSDCSGDFPPRRISG